MKLVNWTGLNNQNKPSSFERDFLVAVREIKLVKVKGTYGSYLVRTKWMNDGEKDLLLIAGIIILLSIIF